MECIEHLSTEHTARQSIDAIIQTTHRIKSTVDVGSSLGSKVSMSSYSILDLNLIQNSHLIVLITTVTTRLVMLDGQHRHNS